MKKSFIEISAYLEKCELIRMDCETAEDYAKLNAEIDEINAFIYNSAIENIATSADPITTLLTAPEVAQIAPVEDNGESVTLKKSMRPITYSAIAKYIKAHNKAIEKDPKVGEKISLPFNNADYVLFNIYGANLSKETLSKLDMGNIKRLAEFVPSVECFKASSNSKLKEQLCHLYARIEEVAGVSAGVKAIERNSKLIAMEFIKYKGLTHTLRINSADKLIDLIIAQYIISRDNIAMTVKSALDIHKVKEDAKTE